MRRPKWTASAGLFAALIATLASGASAQKATMPRAPLVHVFSRAGDVASNYVEPSIEVGEDAYVFVIAMDLDGHIQVLHPEYAGLSVRIRERRELLLKNFFAGSNQGGPGAYLSTGSYSSSYESGYGEDDTRGLIIALASRAPFNFDRIYSGNDWNYSEIRSLIERQTPNSAARNLVAYIGAKGEPIGRDFLRFAGGRENRYASGSGVYLSGCDLSFGYSVAAVRQRTLSHVARLQRNGQRVSVVGYDQCGRPIVAYGPSARGIPRLPATGAFSTPSRAGTEPSANPDVSPSEQNYSEPESFLSEPRRRHEPQSSEPLHIDTFRMPMLPRAQTLSEETAAARGGSQGRNQPAQGSFGSSAQRAPRVIQSSPPARQQISPPPSR